MEVREPAVADSFYPGDKEGLSGLIKEYLSKAKLKNFSSRPKAIIVPHAGYVYSGQVAAFAFSVLKAYKRVVVVGPSHFMVFSGACYDDSEEWSTPLGSVKLFHPDSDFLFPMNSAHAQEHSVEVELPFLQCVLKNFEFLPVLTGEVDPEELAKDIVGLLNENTLLVVSSDLSHYLPYDGAVALDKKSIDFVLKNDVVGFEKSGDACGKTGIAMLMHIAKLKGWKPVLLNYANSGDVTGDKSEVVGYASIAFC